MPSRFVVAFLLGSVGALLALPSLAGLPLEEYRADADIVLTLFSELDEQRWRVDDVRVFVRSREQPLYALDAVSDGEGRVRFRVSSLLAPYDIWAALPGCDSREIPLLTLDELGEGVDEALDLGPVLRVVVVSSERGHPVGGFPVRIRSERGEWTARPRADGVLIFGCLGAGERVEAATRAPRGFEVAEAIATIERPVETIRLVLREVPSFPVNPSAP